MFIVVRFTFLLNTQTFFLFDFCYLINITKREKYFLIVDKIQTIKKNILENEIFYLGFQKSFLIQKLVGCCVVEQSEQKF